MDRFDYIIIGAGSAGCVLANRLSADPANRVLLLEAGGGDAHPYLRMPLAFLKAMVSPKFTWGYTSEPNSAAASRSLWLPRGKVLGGSSSINGMFYMRGHPLDFEEWRQMGAEGWSYGEVLPYFKQMEDSWRGENRYHGTGGPLSVVPVDVSELWHEPLMDAAEKAGYPTSEDLSGASPEGFARGEVTIDRRGRRASSAAAYLRPVLSRPNLEVRTHSLARKVMITEGRATGVEYERDGTIVQVAANREVILSGGAFNSPHLLMLSGIGPGEALTKHGIPVLRDNPAVGQNMSEHTSVSAEFEARRPVTFLRQLRWDRLSISAVRWALMGTGPLASQINSCNVIIRTEQWLDRPDIQVMANPIRFEAQPWLPGIGQRQPHVFWAGIVGLHPYSRGHVTIASSDPRELPRIHTNILYDERDVVTLRRGIRAVRTIYRAGKQGEMTGREMLPGPDIQSDTELDAYIRETTVVAQHPVGTCMMGSGSGTVVDPQLRVHNVDCLRVVDASVMPTVPGANTNAPTIMIAEKASDLILGRHPLPRVEV